MRRVALALIVLVALSGCRRKVSRQDCDKLLETYAALYVSEHSPGLSEEAATLARTKELGEARGDDNFKNCTSEVSFAEYECALHAPTVALFNKCLE